MSILMALLFCLGNIISRAFIYYLVKLYEGFRNYLTRSAYLNVFKVFSEDAEEGEILPIIIVRQNPTKESLSTIVNFEPLNGVCPFP
jgi:hypothetical protein